MSVLDICSCVQSLDSWPLIKRLLENFREALCLQNNFFFPAGKYLSCNSQKRFATYLDYRIPSSCQALTISAVGSIRMSDSKRIQAENVNSLHQFMFVFYLTRNDCRLLGKEIVLGREMEIIFRVGGETNRNMRWVLESNSSWSED